MNPTTCRSQEIDKVPHKKHVWYDDWVRENLQDQTGKVEIVTGANSGTGFWCAKALAGAGATVILACRNPSKAEAAKAEILESHPNAQVDASLCTDNGDLASVRAFAKDFDAKYDRLDILANNAGVMGLPYSTTKDGLEIQFQTNHLAHFLLTKLLWEKLVNTPGQSRVIQHSSGYHRMGSPWFSKDDMEFPQHSFMGYIFWNVAGPILMGIDKQNFLRYAVSKLCNVLFMKSLERRIRSQGLESKIISVAVHPGVAATQLEHVARDAGSMTSGPQPLHLYLAPLLCTC